MNNLEYTEALKDYLDRLRRWNVFLTLSYQCSLLESFAIKEVNKICRYWFNFYDVKTDYFGIIKNKHIHLLLYI